MQATARVLGNVFGEYAPACLIEEPKRGSALPMIPAWLSVPQTAGTWSWNEVKVKTLRSLELFPDLSTLVESNNTITREVYNHLPTWMRVTFASVATMNVFLVPIFLQDVYALIKLMASKMGRGVSLTHSLTLPYLTTLATTMAAIFALGLKEFCHLAEIPASSVDRFLSWVLPWIGYALRLGAVLQMIDIVSHAGFQYDLSRATNEQQVMEVLVKHRAYLRRANGNPTGMKASLLATQARVNSYNPVSRLLGHYKAEALTRELKARTVCYLHNQLLGLGANIFAVAAMMSTNTLGIAYFNIASASHYLAQTVHRWNMIPTVKT